MSRLLAVLLLFCFSSEGWGAQRIVLLAPAAGDILSRLDAEDRVVGVTRSLEEFPKATRVGSHIRPNLEILRALEPDLLIISSERFFSTEMAAAVGARVYSYNPHTLEEILHQIGELAELLGKRELGEELIALQRRKLAQVEPVADPPEVIFEVTAMPFVVAGSHNIVADIIEKAGGKLLTPDRRKLVRFNTEAVLLQEPDIYIYQVGPMNKNPVPPRERSPLNRLKARFLEVDELLFSRPNTVSFDNVLTLNRYFRGEETTQPREDQ